MASFIIESLDLEVRYYLCRYKNNKNNLTFSILRCENKIMKLIENYLKSLTESLSLSGNGV